MLCSTASILQQYEPGVHHLPLRCKRWKCDYCAPRNQSQLKRKALRGRPDTFITLTSNPEMGKDQDDRARILKDAWVKIRRWAKDQWGNEKIEFLAVFEKTKAGEPHLHILARTKWIPHDELSMKLDEYAGAFIAGIERVSSKKNVASYVSKYVGKDPEKFEGSVRFWTSRGFEVIAKLPFAPPLGKPDAWWLELGSFEEVRAKMTRRFYKPDDQVLPSGVEYWYVDDFPTARKEAKTPPLKLEFN